MEILKLNFCCFHFKTENSSIDNSDRPSSVDNKVHSGVLSNDQPISQQSSSSSSSSTVSSQQQQQIQSQPQPQTLASSLTGQQNQSQASQQSQHQSSQQLQSNATIEGKPWNYSSIDLMATGAFWHNYSGMF